MSEVTKYTFSVRKGDVSLTLRSDKLTELEAMADEALQSKTFGPFFGAGVVIEPEANAVTEMVEKTDPAAGEELRQAAVQRLLDEKKAEAATGLTGDEAQAAVTKHLGKGEELASANQIVAAAKKSGKTTEELAGISVSEAKRLIAAGKGK